MSSADFNKVVGAILVSLLAAVAIGIFINETMHHEMMSGEEMAYKVEASGSEATTASAAKEPVLEPVAPLLASADPAEGEKVSKKCTACHSFEKGGPNKVGPDLYDVLTRGRGKREGFAYSPAMAEKGGDWDYASLNHFLANPKEYLPGTKMGFIGLKSVKDRAAIIAYLRQQSDNPPPLP